MKRREFITLLGGAAAAWPVAARAQDGRVRRIGVLVNFNENDPEAKPLLAAFRQRAQELGWVEGRNALIEYRWTAGSADRARAFAAELVGMKPNVILVAGGTALSALMQETRSVSTVFVAAADPVELGFVASLARPGGNATGFTAFERTMATKWLGLLKEIAPSITRVLLLSSDNPANELALPAILAAAPSLGVQSSIATVHDAAEIEQSIDASARESNVGLLVPGSSFAVAHRDLIIALAARHRLPAVYANGVFPKSGGLLSYAVDQSDGYRNAAVYVDRILRGEKPGDLPVQTPTKFELIINLKTAKALGITVPLTLQASADEVIE
jgi:putative tryptophan/tyrosine transport system substrate-binding protein